MIFDFFFLLLGGKYGGHPQFFFFFSKIKSKFFLLHNLNVLSKLGCLQKEVAQWVKLSFIFDSQTPNYKIS